MSEPCPPAFMRTAPPIEPGTPTAHSNPVQPGGRGATGDDGQARRAAGARRCTPSTSIGGERRAQLHGDAGEARVGHEQVRSRCPITSTGSLAAAAAAATGAAGRSTASATTKRAAGPPTR